MTLPPNLGQQMTLILVAILALAACTTTAEPGDRPLAGESDSNKLEPQATLATATSPSDHDKGALQTDARWYADNFDVPFEEALRRLELQKPLGALNAALRDQERKTFAGMWVQNAPDYRVFAAFTQNGEETIQPYIEGQPYADIIEVRSHRYSLAELRVAQQLAMTVAGQLDLVVSSSLDVQENRVRLKVGNPGLFLEEVHAAGRDLPEVVHVVAIDPDHLSESNRGGVESYEGPHGNTIYFPKQPPQAFYHEGDYEGELALDENGCLRLAYEIRSRPYRPLILWHHDFELRVEGDVIEVLNGEEQAVARVGTQMEVGGGFLDTVHVTGIPFDPCPGPYLLLGAIEPLGLQGDR